MKFERCTGLRRQLCCHRRRWWREGAVSIWMQVNILLTQGVDFTNIFSRLFLVYSFFQSTNWANGKQLLAKFISYMEKFSTVSNIGETERWIFCRKLCAGTFSRDTQSLVKSTQRFISPNSVCVNQKRLALPKMTGILKGYYYFRATFECCKFFEGQSSGENWALNQTETTKFSLSKAVIRNFIKILHSCDKTLFTNSNSASV